MWVSIAIIVVGTEICALALILIRRRRQERLTAITKSPIAGDIFGVIGTGFAVILAFVIFTAFEEVPERPRPGGRRVGGDAPDVLPRAVLPVAVTQRPRGRPHLPPVRSSMTNGRSWPPATAAPSWTTGSSGWTPTSCTCRWRRTRRSRSSTRGSRAVPPSDCRRVGAADSPRRPYASPFVWAGSSCSSSWSWAIILFASPQRPLIPQVLGVSAVAATLLAGVVVVYVLDAPFADRGAQAPPTRMQVALTSMEADYRLNAATLLDASAFAADGSTSMSRYKYSNNVTCRHRCASSRELRARRVDCRGDERRPACRRRPRWRRPPLDLKGHPHRAGYSPADLGLVDVPRVRLPRRRSQGRPPGVEDDTRRRPPTCTRRTPASRARRGRRRPPT